MEGKGETRTTNETRDGARRRQARCFSAPPLKRCERRRGSRRSDFTPIIARAATENESASSAGCAKSPVFIRRLAFTGPLAGAHASISLRYMACVRVCVLSSLARGPCKVTVLIAPSPKLSPVAVANRRLLRVSVPAATTGRREKLLSRRVCSLQVVFFVVCFFFSSPRLSRDVCHVVACEPSPPALSTLG